MGNYKGINQKGLVFHALPKQEKYKKNEIKLGLEHVCNYEMRSKKPFIFLPIKSLL